MTGSPELCTTCPECLAHLCSASFPVEAYCSVSSEIGKSPEQVRDEYLAEFHRRGHVEP